ncbi:MAG: hypothetical protein GWN54_07255, partial [Gammaproteobacteria bacterium]|nr:hypothetical protein [Gammaproteobacteria bacterium]
MGLSILCLSALALHAWLPPLQQRLLVEGGGANPAQLAEALAEPGLLLPAGEWLPLVLALFIHTSWLHLV